MHRPSRIIDLTNKMRCHAVASFECCRRWAFSRFTQTIIEVTKRFNVWSINITESKAKTTGIVHYSVFPQGIFQWTKEIGEMRVKMLTEFIIFFEASIPQCRFVPLRLWILNTAIIELIVSKLSWADIHSFHICHQPHFVYEIRIWTLDNEKRKFKRISMFVIGKWMLRFVEESIHKW